MTNQSFECPRNPDTNQCNSCDEFAKEVAAKILIRSGRSETNANVIAELVEKVARAERESLPFGEYTTCEIMRNRTEASASNYAKNFTQ